MLTCPESMLSQPKRPDGTGSVLSDKLCCEFHMPNVIEIGILLCLPKIIVVLYGKPAFRRMSQSL